MQGPAFMVGGIGAAHSFLGEDQSATNKQPRADSLLLELLTRAWRVSEHHDGRGSLAALNIRERLTHQHGIAALRSRTDHAEDH